MTTALFGVPRPRLSWLAGFALVTSLACQSSDPVTVIDNREVLGYGTAYFDADTGTVEFSATGPAGALLDATDVLPGATAHNCEAAGWNPGTLVLSVNAMIANQSQLTSAVTYHTPIELRLTGITQADVVNSVNTDLINATCGANGLSLANDDGNGDGRFDCILPVESDSENDPGWDFSGAVGTDDELEPGPSPNGLSGCRFIHFNLLSETDFNFQYAILGIVADGWPPAPFLNSVTTPTASSPGTVSGYCMVTTEAPDTGGPLAASDSVFILGGASPVENINCVQQTCENHGGIDYCGGFTADVPLRSNDSNHLEVYQILDGLDRGGSSYVDIVHDDTAPQVVSTQPADGALGVVIAVDVLVTFSEVVDAATINSNTVYVQPDGGSAVAAVVTLDGSSTRAIINPNVDLTANTLYEVVIEGGGGPEVVEDLAGNRLASTVITTFTTADDAADTIPPAVVSVQPPNGASNVDRRTNVVISFTEAIQDVVAGDIEIRDVVRDQVVPGAFTMSPDRTQVTFVPDANYDTTGGAGCVDLTIPPDVHSAENDFDCNSNYRVTVTTAVEDLSGNPLANPYVSTFNTGVEPDETPPTVDAFIPPAAATEVSVDIQPQVLFSEPINPATVNTSTFFLKEEGVTLVPATVIVAGDGLSARLIPSSPLKLSDPDPVRYVIFVNNGVEDLAGNPLAAPVNSDFTTAAAPDTTRPYVVSVTPQDGIEDVSRTTNVVIQFSEPLDPATVNTGTVLLDDMGFGGGAVQRSLEGQVGLSPDGLVVIFTPFDELRWLRMHRLTVSYTISDLAGNPMGVDAGDNFVSWFRAEGNDDVAPCVTAVSPADGSTDVPDNSHIAVVFSEPMNPSSVVESAFTLTDGTGPIAKSVSLSADQTQALITPVGPLPGGPSPGAPIYLTVTTALEDDSVETNALDQGSTASGCLDPTGGAELAVSFYVNDDPPDTTGPLVDSVSPPDSQTDVSVATDVVITFNEAIDPLTASAANILLTDPSGNPVGTDFSFSSNLEVLTLDPHVLLEDLAVYTLTIPTSVRDLAGNALQWTVISYFTTINSALDTDPPDVSWTCPADDAVDVDRWLLACTPSGKVVIEFNEALNGDTVHLGNFHLVEYITWWIFTWETDITQAVELLPGGTTVIITPDFGGGGLSNDTYHHIRISTAVTDTAGNPLAAVDRCALGTGVDCSDFTTVP